MVTVLLLPQKILDASRAYPFIDQRRNELPENTTKTADQAHAGCVITSRSCETN